MSVGFILKNRSSLSQTDRPPNTVTRAAVTTCMWLSLPVKAHRAAVDARMSGTKAAVTTMKPS